MTRAALYLRQSLDRHRTEEGIDRQRARCTALAEARGWRVEREYQDNDTSASKARGEGTGWAAMLAEADAFDVVIAVDMDRLLRTLPDLVAITSTGTRVVTVDGEIDLTTADGEFRATMLAGIARFEGRRKSERQRRANEQRRAAGIPAGHRAPFGYRQVPAAERLASGAAAPYAAVPGEAEAVRELFREALAGTSMKRLTAGLIAAGHRTARTRRHPEGGTWSPTSVRRLLLSPFYAALIPEPNGTSVYRPEDVDPGRCVPGQWEPLVSRDEWLAVRTLLLDPDRRKHQGTARRWLLAGLACCSVCGLPVRAGGRGNGVAVYRCRDDHFSRLAEPIEAYVVEVVLARLAQPDALALLQPADDGLTELRAERDTLDQRARGLAGLVADGTFTPKQAQQAQAGVRARLEAIDSQLSASVRPSPLSDLLGADDLPTRWAALNLDRRRAVVDTLMRVEVAPVGKGKGWAHLIPETVRIEWKGAA